MKKILVLVLLIPLHSMGQDNRNLKIVRYTNRKSIVSDVVVFNIERRNDSLYRIIDFDVNVDKINSVSAFPSDDMSYSMRSYTKRMLPANDTIMLYRLIDIESPVGELNNTIHR